MATSFKAVKDSSNQTVSFRVRFRLTPGANPVSETFKVPNPANPASVAETAAITQRFCTLVDSAGGAAARAARRASLDGVGDSVETCFRRFLTHSATSSQRDTRAKYMRDWERHIAPRFAAWPAAAVTREQIEDWVGTLRETETARSQADPESEPDYLSPKTIKNIHGLLSGVFKNEVVAGRLPFNPAYKVPLPTMKKKREPVFLSESQYAELSAVIAPEWVDFLHFAVGTGLRWSEITALTPEDFDLEGTIASVRITKAWKKDVKGKAAYVGAPKTINAIRTVSMSDQVAKAIIPRIDRTEPGDLVFRGPRGGRLRGQWFHERVWGPAVEKAQIPRRPVIHDLRHTHASWLIRAGVPLTVIQRRMGHASIKVTSDTYGHLAPDALAVAAEAMSQSMALALPILEESTPRLTQ